VICPNCDSELKLSERQGVEIDYCPKCRGVWLDRGELDKIVERSAPTVQLPRYQDNDDDDRRTYSSDDSRYSEKKKRKSFIEDLFDF
jgi:uncharacterized protein